MRHSVRLVLIALVVVMGTLSHAMSSPPPAKAGIPGLPSPCDLIPNDTLKAVCKIGDPTQVLPGVPGIGIPGFPTPGGIINQAAQAVADTFIGEIVHLENSAVAWLLAKIVNTAYGSNSNIYTLAWWVAQYAFAFGIGVILALYVWAYNVFIAAKRGDSLQILKSSGYFVSYFYGATFFPLVLAISLFLADNVLAPAELKVAGFTSTQASLKHLLDLYTNQAGNTALPLLLSAIVLLIGMVGGAILFFQLFYRHFMLYLMPPATVLAYSVRDSGPWAYAMAYRCTRQIIALVLFKVIYVTIIIFALLAASTNPVGATPLIEVAALLGISPILTWAAFRIIGGDSVSPSDLGRGLRRHGPKIGSWVVKTATAGRA